MTTQNKSSSKKNNKGGWSKDQDEYLLNLNETKDWNVVAEEANLLFPYFHKTPQEYCKRWQTLMNGAETKESWSAREEVDMLLAHHKYKNKWSEIGMLIKGRSNNTIKNKFYSIFRRIKGKIQKFDYTYCSKLELLEIYYIISLIEQYLANQSLNPKIKGKRGKDFIYSLIHNLSLKTVTEYKVQLQKLSKEGGDLDKLFKELSTEDKPFTEEPKPKIEILEKSSVEAKAFVEEIKEQIVGDMLYAKQYLSIELEEISVVKGNCMINKTEAEDYLCQFRVPEQDASLAIEMDFVSPKSLFSPLNLSAGPAAAAARAPNAACFNIDVQNEGFGDISFLAKKLSDERLKSQSSCTNERAYSTIQD
jgi:hypothetical protein